jgi:hypothetical protein
LVFNYFEHPSENQLEEEEALMQLLETPYQLEPPINRLKRVEGQEVMNSLNPKKSSGYDLITGKILKELSIIGIKYLTQLLNAVLLKGYFLAQWKVTQILLLLKPRKPHNELTSYWPISLLPIELFHSKALRMTVDVPWYVPNTVIRRDLQIPTVKEEIRRYSSQYSARLSAHPNGLIVNLMELPDNRRL